jgi:sugar (pentulose or hexulose) kinase
VILLGIDVGTQGARVLACDPQGAVLAQAGEAFAARPPGELPAGWFEQHPDDWWTATTACLRRVVGLLANGGHAPAAIAGLSVASTSGSVCLVDAAGQPQGPALMYNDARAVAEAQEVSAAGAALEAKLGYRFASSYALPKLLWLKRHQPARFEAARHILSPTDFIVGRLSGQFDVSDYNNALKTGFDLLDECWPEFIERDLGIPRERLPHIVAPGTPVGQVTEQAAAATGLAAGTPVLAGTTDGCAAQVSTGAVAPGEWNSTLGTTLVLKGVTRSLLRDPLGRIYCHRHPDGYWLAGGASNVGGECIAQRFPAAHLERLNAAALAHAPSDLIIYPLVARGERFPFVRPQAQGFTLGDSAGASEEMLYTAYLEGVGYVERLAYETLHGLGAELGDAIYAAGGATGSGAWLQLRADILGRALWVPRAGGSAMGAAIVAAAGALYGGIVPAAQAMVRIEAHVEPRPALRAQYDERYARFCAACRERGYLEA